MGESQRYIKIKEIIKSICIEDSTKEECQRFWLKYFSFWEHRHQLDFDNIVLHKADLKNKSVKIEKWLIQKTI